MKPALRPLERFIGPLREGMAPAAGPPSRVSAAGSAPPQEHDLLGHGTCIAGTGRGLGSINRIHGFYNECKRRDEGLLCDLL